MTIDIEGLSVFQKKDQIKQMQRRAENVLSKVVNQSDAPDCMRLLFNEAATYNVLTGEGGVDGSLFLSSELQRPANQSLQPLVEKLRQAKVEIDEKAAKIGQGPISYADLMVLAAKVAVQDAWLQIKIARSRTPEDGRLVATQFGSPFDVRLGRVDRAQPGPDVALPTTASSPEDIKEFLRRLDNPKPDAAAFLFGPKPPFWERPGFQVWCATAADPQAEEDRLAAADKAFASVKKEFDISRRTLSRTDYEVDFVTNFNKLADLGAQFNSKQYLYPLEVTVNRL